MFLYIVNLLKNVWLWISLKSLWGEGDVKKAEKTSWMSKDLKMDIPIGTPWIGVIEEPGYVVRFWHHSLLPSQPIKEVINPFLHN